MADLFENPLGTDGFEFVEFAGPDPDSMGDLFERMGFTAVGRHKRKDVIRYQQGEINFLLNRETTGHAADFAKAHGPAAVGMAFRVRDAQFAYREAMNRGADPAEPGSGPLGLEVPILMGIGGSYLYLCDRYTEHAVYDQEFKPIEGAVQRPDAGLTYLDHLTHNVFRGNMSKWAGFYERVFNFREIRYFDIEGKVTGLTSRAMTSPDGKIRIPLNESKGNSDQIDQIEEYLREYKGEGIQHIALGSRDLYQTVDTLTANGVPLQDVVETYYELVDTRLPGHGEPLEELRKRRILIDGAPSDDQGLLLQIFGKNAFGPIFFEFIQRKGNEGFGEGNFKALFESIELDQIRRGVIQAPAAE
ncbi:MAG: 4-hydroxyphenylpyruvate dioxygenase [Proteobacteria bacterium]|nr:4-hydroxyphenylpyruvate dioxygenase [Pseudomonadota bacterium]